MQNIFTELEPVFLWGGKQQKLPYHTTTDLTSEDLFTRCTTAKKAQKPPTTCLWLSVAVIAYICFSMDKVGINLQQ